MLGFERVRNTNSLRESIMGNIFDLSGELDNKQIQRLKTIMRNWDFYDGYHWEDMPETDGPQITFNYCRAFVNKFVSFELGNAFTISTHKDMEEKPITPDGRTSFEYLEDVWEDNDQYRLAIELGQMKSVTGEAWLQVRYYTPEEMADTDPFGEYEQGRVRILLMPTQTVFPEFDPHDRDKLVKLTVMYSYEAEEKSGLLGRKTSKTKVIYKQIWDKDKCVVIDGKKDPVEFPNKYKAIPFVLIKNLTIAGRNECSGDLDDVIPLNVEMNLKRSDISEIIDYHAAPVTIVYGAKVGNLEKGANKMWGGLAKDARVENLELRGDLGASTNYANGLKVSMCEIGGIPESVLGGAQSISNTSGIAMQYMNLPLIEKTKIKRSNTENGLEALNKLILLVSLCEGLIRKPDDISTRDFFYNECTIPDTLPKDTLMELQQIQVEMRIGIESRRGAAKRLGKENIDAIFAEVDKDRESHPEYYGGSPQEGMPEINSGVMNGQTPVEQVRTEITGSNGMSN